MRRTLIIISFSFILAAGLVQMRSGSEDALYLAAIGVAAFFAAGVLHSMKGKPQ